MDHTWTNTRRHKHMKCKIAEDDALSSPQELIKALILPEGIGKRTGKKEGKELAPYVLEEQNTLPFVRTCD